ncbi:hypothetical protein UFOVP100_9 [uncultured Caudovirales phage]|uniref:Uncharacterized protein n=1 Tax=uncultured Caudovirales phage TaxID=2100421 RepID=A0A6J5L054_9CAUD|nr:hypothetical protein UFOVP100_9 [uncultured Caudovirales phage]
MHQIKTDFLEAILQYLAKQPYNEVVQLIGMVQQATSVPAPEPE